jgi:hypothetical protein
MGLIKNQFTMKKLLILFLSIFLSVSCYDNNEVETNEVDRMVFSSQNEFKSVTDKISKLNDQELDEWEKSHNFISFRSVLNGAYKEFELVSNEKELYEFLKKYDDILTIKDSVLTPLITISIHQAIANRNGFYEINHYLNKIVGDYIVSSEKSNIDRLMSINSVEQLNGISDRDIQAIKYIDTENSNISGRVNAACSTNMFASYFKNESNCRNDREVNLFVKSYRDISTDASGTYYYPKVEIIVQPRKRLGTFCSWTGYNNPTELRNTSFTILGWQRLSYTSSGTTSQLALYSFNLPYVYNPYGNGYKWTQAVGDWTFNEPVSAFAFTTLHAEGKSQGVGVDGWAIIDCQ